MSSMPGMLNDLPRRDKHLRLACLLMIGAIGLYAAYAQLVEPTALQKSPHWAAQWWAGYLIFIASYLLGIQSELTHRRRVRILWLAAESATALFLVWVYPSFIVTCLLVVVAWQIAWTETLRTAVLAAAFQAVALAVMKCTVHTNGSFPLLILVIAIGFQAFAISAARLARSEARARDELARANVELRAAQALMTESARMSERLRISRDLHDVLGHSLTSLTIHLDVAGRLASGQAVEHVRCAREVAGALLTEVRSLVNRVRVDPVDLRETLLALAEGAVGLKVELSVPEDLAALDPARADAIVRCAQEAITNTLRHAKATQIDIQVEQAVDGAVRIAVRDDGCGGRFVEGGGLAGMRERFTLLGGELSIGSPEGGGFIIQGAIPTMSAYS
jgi:signal transduction histidine kinase